LSEPTTRILDLSDYWNMVRARRWVVVITAVVLAFVSATYVLLKPDVFVSQAKVVVTPLINPVVGISGSTSNALQPDMGTEAEIVKSVTVAQDVQSKLKLTQTPQALLKNLSVGVVGETTVMVLSFKDADAQVAAQIAQAFAVSYLEQRNKTVHDSVGRAIAPLQATIDSDNVALKEIEDQLANTSSSATSKIAGLKFQASLLQTSIQDATARINEIQSTGDASQGGQLVQGATVPNKPSGPNLPLAAGLGLFVGALLGCGIAIVSGLRENKVGGRDELAHHLGAPVMAVIPRVEGWDRAETAELVTREEPGAPASEAYRTLATNVRFLRSQQPLRIMVVTSAMPGEGKSATAANLAVVLAETGLRTVLVDADLRRPRASRFIGVNDRAGLREALDGTRDLVDVIQATDTENLWIVGAGVVPQDPVSLLAGPNADAVFDGLRRVADIVVCDAPPTLPVADASVLAEESDAVLFVHDPSISNRTALEDAVRQLRTAGGNIIGGVYNNISAAQRNYLGYASYDEYYGPDRNAFHPMTPEIPTGVAAEGTGKGGNGWKPQGDRTSQLPGGRS
jgi:capsular exopolysaccharide synthesis family protein